MRPSFELPADAPAPTRADGSGGRRDPGGHRVLPGGADRTRSSRRGRASGRDRSRGKLRVYRICRICRGPAAQAVVYSEEFLRNPGENDVIEVVAAAFGAGRVLAANVDTFMMDLVVAALLADVDKLVSMGHGTIPDLGPPIDPSENGPLGPLWPAGTPLCYAPRVWAQATDGCRTAIVGLRYLTPLAHVPGGRVCRRDLRGSLSGDRPRTTTPLALAGSLRRLPGRSKTSPFLLHAS